MNWNPFAMFEEKPVGSGISMSRVIALMFAVTYCYALTLVARNTGPSTIMGWPYACLGIVVVMSIPLQSLFRTIVSWFATPPGKALMQTLIGKAGSALETKITTTSVVATGTPSTDKDKA